MTNVKTANATHTYEATIQRGGRFSVGFGERRYERPRRAASGDRRMKRAVTCSVVPLDHTDRLLTVTGLAECSVKDRYSYPTGCRIAMDRAVEGLVRQGVLDLEGVEDPAGYVAALAALQHEFARVVMPQVAAEYRARPRRPARRPNPRKLLAKAVEDMAAVMMVVAHGRLEAAMQILQEETKARLNAQRSRAKAREQREKAAAQ